MGQVGADFETGTVGNTLSTGDTGSPTAFNTINSTGTISYDNAQVHSGSKSCQIATVAAAGPYFAWTTPYGTNSETYGRTYLYLTALPAASLDWMRMFSGASIVTRLRITSAGKIAPIDSAGVSMGTGTSTISVNQWIRVEWRILHNAGAGTYEVRLFNTPESTTATETLSGSSKQTGANSDSIRFGNLSAAANVGPYWYDDVVAGAATWVGPLATDNPVPSSMMMAA